MNKFDALVQCFSKCVPRHTSALAEILKCDAAHQCAGKSFKIFLIQCAAGQKSLRNTAIVKNYQNHLNIFKLNLKFYRMLKKRDANNEVPANFGDFMNMWSLESITCISLNVRLGILNSNFHDENAEKLIQVC